MNILTQVILRKIERQKESLLSSAIFEKYGLLNYSDIRDRGRQECYPSMTRFFIDNKPLIDIYDPVNSFDSEVINTEVRFKKY